MAQLCVFNSLQTTMELYGTERKILIISLCHRKIENKLLVFLLFTIRTKQNTVSSDEVKNKEKYNWGLP